jgi:hypothetical protein
MAKVELIKQKETIMISLDSQRTFLELLPRELISNILDQLNQETGSEGIVNKADIPVVMRYARSLICTSKKMAAQMNHPDVTRLFLNSLSKKYDQSSEHFAVLFNTIGARTQLWDYIQENGDDKAYQAIQEIYKLASDVLKEAKSAGLLFECSQDNQSRPNPFYSQTKQGLILYIDWAPTHLATPFGKIEIYEGAISSHHCPLSVAELFIRRLNAVFERMACVHNLDGRDSGEFFEITASSGPDTIRKISSQEKKRISKKEAESKKGTQNLIVNSLSRNFGIYKIREVKGKKIPDVIWPDSEKSMRSYELINAIWKMLKANRLGQDPIAKKIKQRKVAKVVAESIDIKALFNNISEVSQWGIELITKLEQQPIVPYKTNNAIKLLVLERYHDAQVIESLNSAANQFLDKNSRWPIYAVGSINHHPFLNEGHGIMLQKHKKTTSCDLNNLKRAYDSVIKSIGQNWVTSKLKDHPTICHTQSEEDYVLFVKKENILEQEALFIKRVAPLLGLSQFISCYDIWKNKDSQDIYLWIRKDHLEKTLAALNIRPLA